MVLISAGHGALLRRTGMIEKCEPRRLMSSYVIDGVQPIAFDQPQIHGLFRHSSGGTPISAVDPDTGDTSFDVQGFLDTGTSGILLSRKALKASTFNPKWSTGNRRPSRISASAEASSLTFRQTLYASMANFSPTIDGTDASAFKQTLARCALRSIGNRLIHCWATRSTFLECR